MNSTGSAGQRRIGLWVTLVCSLVYCCWLGANWLPLDYSDKELAGFVSRVWDIKREISEHGHLPWWTPNYMSGSSYGLNHSHGLYLVPWLLLSTVFSLPVAGKLTALAAMFGGAVAMFFCARHFLRDEWAATLAALAFLFHPEQIIRAAGAEHMTIIMFFPFIPLTWWLFARALESGKFRDAFWCALSSVCMLGMDNKQALIQYTLLACYVIYWLSNRAGGQDRAHLQAVRTGGLIGILGLGLGACFIVPGLMESKHVKLFYGDPIEGWQRNYAFKSLLALVDRDGAVSRQAWEAVVQALQAGRYQTTNQQQADELQSQIMRIGSLRADSPEKYAGIALLAVLALTAVFNRDRVNRRLFWFFVAMLLATVLLSYGLSNVWSANSTTLRALFGLEGVPSSARLFVLLPIVAATACLAVFAKRKLTTPRKRIIASVAVLVFLFLPAFQILALLPFFKEIRAPFVFYDLPAAFFGAMLAGFFVTDVLPQSRRMKIVAALAVVFLADYWPYQKPMKDYGISPGTLANLRSTYEALRNDSDWVKTYSFSGRYFHLLGPMYSGKPQVYEAFYNWMCPLGTGLLNQNGAGSPVFFNLMGARYVVVDKSEPGNEQQSQQIASAYRRLFPVHLENADFIVFRNESARPFVSGYSRRCLFVGDVRRSAPAALALASRNLPLVHRDELPPMEQLVQYDQIYTTDANLLNTMPPAASLKTVVIREGGPLPVPPTEGEMVALSGVQLVRERSGLVRIKLGAPATCIAVIAESYYPFWHAELDGKSAELLRVSCGLMGLELGAGQHEVLLRYVPPRAYAVAGGVSLLTLLGSVGAMIWAARRAHP